MASARGANPRRESGGCGSIAAGALLLLLRSLSLVLPAALFLEPLGDPALLTEALL